MRRALHSRDRRAVAGQHRDSSRRGFSVVELMVATSLLATAFALLAPTLSWVRHQRRLADDRQLALLELSNVAERLALVPYDELTVERLTEANLSPEGAAALPTAKFTASLAEEDDPPAKRITLNLAWQADGVRPSAPLRLVIWRFSEEEAMP